MGTTERQDAVRAPTGGTVKCLSCLGTRSVRGADGEMMCPVCKGTGRVRAQRDV